MGTIFRVGSKYGMTAEHVISAITNPRMQVNGDDTRLSQEHVCVTFGESGADLSHKFKLSKRIAFTDSTLDVAIVAFVEDSNHPLQPPLSLLRYDVCSSLDDVAIVGFGHRTNGFKCIEHSVKVVDPESVPVDASKEYIETHHKTLTPVLKRLGKKYRSVDAGYTGYKDPQRVLLNAYVGPGASGSPIFTKNDPGALKVVCVYTCGYPALRYELPSTIRHPMEWTVEGGTRINYVYEVMERSVNNESLGTLAAELFSD